MLECVKHSTQMSKAAPYLFGIGSTVVIIAAAAALSYVAVDAGNRPSPYLTEDPHVAEHNAKVILTKKCAACHGAEPEIGSFMNALSFGKIRRDVEGAQRAFLLDPQDGGLRSGHVDYLKMDRVLRTRRMPPALYTTVHLGSRLTPDDIDILRCRYKEDAALVRAFSPIQSASEPENGLEALRIQLGHLLFFDARLSTNNKIACASCHDLTLGGTDNKAKSEGVEGPDGKPQLGGVNAPSVYNAAGNIKQFWDGRAANLQEQAGGPPLNPVEMGYAKPDDWNRIIGKLQQDPALVSLFALVYGERGMSADTITDAIAAYERTLVTPDSAFDLFLKGDKNALTDEQKAGLEAYVSNGCATCHAGATLGGISFEYINTHADFHDSMPKGYAESAHGLADFTKKAEHKDMFRVPNLRNVALTKPYFHTGAVTELEDAVRIMFRTQVGTEASDRTVANVTRFLEAQTGKYKGKPLDRLTPEDVRPSPAAR